VKASSGYPVHNLNTGLNYTTIQEGINANETLDWHTLLVEGGHYFEHIVVNKSISLIGEDRESTVIDGSNTDTVVSIKANQTIIKGFTICNSGADLGDAGFYLGFVQDIRIERNTIKNSVGIYGISSHNITFSENIMNYNWFGLSLIFVSNSNITANVMESNHYGIKMSGCIGNILSNNSMNNNVYNFGILGDSLEEYIHHVDTTNTINERFVYYVLNEKNKVIDPSTFPDVGYLGIVNSTHIKVDGLDVSKNWCALLLAYTNESTITNANIADSFHGIYSFYSDNNTIENSRLVGNSYGLEQFESNNNTVIRNTFAKSGQGIFYVGCNGNTIVGNTIENSTYMGVYISSSSNNLIYHNNFVQNAIQVSPTRDSNSWDNGYPSGGNYWSDYNGFDSDPDGIGDTEYVIDTDNIDHYPLMGMFSDFNATLEHHVQTICDSSITDFQSSGTSISFNVTGEDGTSGFCRICIPTALMNETYRIFVNGTEIQHTLLPCSNGTYSYLYFSYTHSTEEVIIIPEFPSFLILPLFFIPTLLAVIVYRKKHAKISWSP
jgi:parallel beta-helix repeat protein